jgi:ribosome maturation factor RimP
MVSLVNEGGKTLKIIIDGQNGVRLNIEDCQKVSKAIAPILDVEDIISGKYLLEVSSAGVERPLVKRQDYLRFINYVILIKLKELLGGKKKYKGVLTEVNDQDVVIQTNHDEQQLLVTIPFANIKAANLVMTDEIFRAILKSEKT